MSKQRESDIKLSKKAQELSDKLFICELPCNTYGICSPCNQAKIFQAGYNLGCDSVQEKYQKLMTESIKLIEALENLKTWGYMTQFKDIDQAILGFNKFKQEIEAK